MAKLEGMSCVAAFKEFLEHHFGNKNDVTMVDLVDGIRFDFHKPLSTSIFAGTIGKGTKIVTFKKEDFKPELAPKRAKLNEFNIDGQNYVRMVY